jgi:hypothetical protein
VPLTKKMKTVASNPLNTVLVIIPGGMTSYKGMVRSDMSKPTLIFFFTARVHTKNSLSKF